jgi:hypothetical protein
MVGSSSIWYVTLPCEYSDFVGRLLEAVVDSLVISQSASNTEVELKLTAKLIFQK